MQQALEQMKDGARKAWSAGSYAEVAEKTIWEVGPFVVGKAGIGEGERVLDVACGTGNAAIRAAEAGGRVTGVDLTPELFERGRELAAEAGVEVEWTEGDAEALPFDDESFDVVTSIFGCMFAPRHSVTAGEIARVLKPGGRFAVAAWQPSSTIGRFFKLMSGYAPPPPDFASPPPMWGDRDHVRELFAPHGIELEFDEGSVDFAIFDSPEDQLEFYLERFGPLMMAREAAESDGRWEELRAKILELYADETPAEYLVSVGRKPG